MYASKTSWCLPVLLATLGVLGCKTPHFSDLSTSTVSSLVARTNILQPGDLIGITFQYSTNFNTSQKLPSDGVLNLEGVGAVQAAGKTPLELQEELARVYRPQVKDDVVTVRLLSTAAVVYVSGAVLHPGRVPLERPMTALEAVMEAGGFDASRARASAVTVIRIESGHQKAFHLNLKRALQGLEESPFLLKPFDIVHIPTKTFNF